MEDLKLVISSILRFFLGGLESFIIWRSCNHIVLIWGYLLLVVSIMDIDIILHYPYLQLWTRTRHYRRLNVTQDIYSCLAQALGIRCGAFPVS